MRKTRNLQIVLLLAFFIGLATTAQGGINDGLIAYYPFDGNANDLSGNGQHATAYNNYEYVPGVSSDAIRLVGSGHAGFSGSHVLLPSLPLDEMDEFTIGMWVNHEGNTTYHGESFIHFGSDNYGDTVGIGYNTDPSNLFFHVGDNTVSIQYGSSFANNWQHLTLRADNGVLTGYLNGQSIGSTTYNLGAMQDFAGLGCHWWGSEFSSGSNRFIGMIDDVRIWDRALSNAEVASLIKVQTPQKPDVISFPDPAPVTSASNVVYMVHGWNDSSGIFTTPRDSEDASLLNTNMKTNIENALGENSDWDVLTYDWSSDAEIKPQDILVMGPSGECIPSPRAKRAAESHGRALAKSILDNPNYNKDTGQDGDVHLIGHSLGGCVINEAVRYLNASPDWNGQVQVTFLDAYTPDGWEKTFGKEATWAEHYYHDGLAVNTQDDLSYAHNVDITGLLDDSGIPNPIENHKWPLRWYDSTIGQSSGYGFPTSMESFDSDEIWLSPILYSYSPAGSISNQQVVNPVDQTISTSSTGTIAVSSDLVTLGTGSPVWINLTLDVENTVNFLEFSYEFTSDADGLLSVYLDDILLGTYYERNVIDGLQSSGYLFLEENLEPGFHVLAFRVDPLTDEYSSVNLSGIQTGYFAIVPEPSSFVLLGMCLVVFLMRRCLLRNNDL